MATPGFSIYELLLAVKKFKDIYDAFRHPYNSAAHKLAAFHEELKRVEQSLKYRDTIYEQTGQKFRVLKLSRTSLTTVGGASTTTNLCWRSRIVGQNGSIAFTERSSPSSMTNYRDSRPGWLIEFESSSAGC